MAKPKPTPTPMPLEERMLKEQADLIKMRDQMRLQLNGLENQLYLIERLLKPPEDDSPPPQGVPIPEGTI